ncbi:MAG: PilZ domain-containing protein [Pseudomonadales bacterium]|nr:PilZ domain-containing protein [Pseudomonadales bacterium]
MDTTSDNNDSKQDERRQLYRIDDTAIIDLTLVSAEDVESKPAEACFVESEAFRLMRELRGIDTDSGSVFRAIHEKTPEIALYLQAINKKIETVGNAVAASLVGIEAELQSVDISEGGIGFNFNSELEADSYHAVKIWFHQTLIGIAAYIRVVACHRTIDGGYHISCAFQSLPDVDEQVIARHIMQVQAREQRKKHSPDK